MPDARDMIQEAAQQPTFDALMRRDPRVFTAADRRIIVEHYRQERAQYEIKESRRLDKKAEKEAG